MPRRTPRIILDKTLFPITEKLNVGDKGQMNIKFSVIGERLDTSETDTDIIIKELQLDKAELVVNKSTRV